MEFKSNITQGIASKIGKNLHNKKNHPLEIIKRKIYDYFGESFIKFDNLDSKVTTENNFDKLLIPKDHPARSCSDTYYCDENHVLRTHTTAHQCELLIAGHTKFLVTGDVFRKDEINFSHYPIFHQMEGVCVMEDGQNAEEALKNILSGLIDVLFPECEYRFKSDYFPFTDPSFEVEVMFQDKWLEVLGCGIVQKKIMENCGLGNKTAFAFGMGIERLAMKLFNIPDIRYFWSEDEKFIKQFESGEIITFKMYSDFPFISRDISFWTDNTFTNNDFCEIIRQEGNDLIENVSLVDEFTHPKTGRSSKCYRIIYRSNDKTLTSEEVNEIQESIKNITVEKLKVEIR